MTVFSPTALMRVLTTLVDRSLDDQTATTLEEAKPARRSRRAHFTQDGTHLELIHRGGVDDKVRDAG
jgi:hypothetical protein